MDDITRARRRRNDPEAAKVAEAVEAIVDYVGANFATKVMRHNPLCGRPASEWRRAGQPTPYASMGRDKQDGPIEPIGWCCKERWRAGAGPGRG